MAGVLSNMDSFLSSRKVQNGLFDARAHKSALPNSPTWSEKALTNALNLRFKGATDAFGRTQMTDDTRVLISGVGASIIQITLVTLLLFAGQAVGFDIGPALRAIDRYLGRHIGFIVTALLAVGTLIGLALSWYYLGRLIYAALGGRRW